LCVGGTHYTKRLPLHRLLQLAGLVNGPLVLIGGPQDREVGGQIAGSLGARAYDATGRYDLLGSASLIARAAAVITHDSGSMHIAAAFQRRVASLWGNTVPAFGMSAYLPKQPQDVLIAEVSGLRCRPCSKLGYDHCPQGHFHCMERQDLARIAQFVNEPKS
jgi:ADP-heptose:LPS heptosyltransferase